MACRISSNTPSGNGAGTLLMRWDAAFNVSQVGIARNFPNNASVMPFESEGKPHTLVYEPNNGNITLYGWEPNGDEKEIWSRNAALPQNLELAPFVFKRETPDKSGPHFLAYNNNGTTSLYTWVEDLSFHLVWTRTWPQNLTFMPFLMGHEWVNKQEQITPKPLQYDIQQNRLTPNTRASSVVVANDGDTVVFYAAFWANRITDASVRNEFKDKGQVYLSLDHGHTWKQLGSFPAIMGRITLAVQPTNIRTIYALTETGELFRYEREAKSAVKSMESRYGHTIS